MRGAEKQEEEISLFVCLLFITVSFLLVPILFIQIIFLLMLSIPVHQTH